MSAPISQQVHTETISPKQRFQQSGTRLSNHRELISSEEFRVAVDTALLQYQTELSSKCTDPNAAMRMGLCLLGANELITVMRQLGDTITITRTTVNDNLKAV